MNVKRRFLIALTPIVAAVSGHVLFGRINPHHLDQAPPQLWHHALAIGVMMSVGFLGLVFLDSLICRTRAAKTAFVLDIAICAIATTVAFYFGREWMAM